MSFDPWDDLRDRLQRAAATLDEQAAERDSSYEKWRLIGKAQGARLALSYMDEADRLSAAPDPNQTTLPVEPVLSETP